MIKMLMYVFPVIFSTNLFSMEGNGYLGDDVHAYSPLIARNLKFCMEADREVEIDTASVFKEMNQEIQKYKGKNFYAKGAVAIQECEESWLKKKDFDAETQVDTTRLIGLTWDYTKRVQGSVSDDQIGIMEVLFQQMDEFQGVCITGRTNRLYQIYRMKFDNLFYN